MGDIKYLKQQNESEFIGRNGIDGQRSKCKEACGVCPCRVIGTWHSISTILHFNLIPFHFWIFPINHSTNYQKIQKLKLHFKSVYSQNSQIEFKLLNLIQTKKENLSKFARTNLNLLNPTSNLFFPITKTQLKFSHYILKVC